MSLPNYLSKIKSSGIYHFVWDKSVVPAQEAETLRLVVGYSDKGPFNTPVYIDNTSDFINIFGRPSKRLEKKGIFFHRMAIQALGGGPILALNLKPFDKESVNAVHFNALQGDKTNYLYFNNSVVDDALTNVEKVEDYYKVGLAFGAGAGADVEVFDYWNDFIKKLFTGGNANIAVPLAETSDVYGEYIKFHVDGYEADSFTGLAKGSPELLGSLVLHCSLVTEENESAPISGLEFASDTSNYLISLYNANYVSNIYYDEALITSNVKVKDLYDTSRFWKLDEDQLPTKINRLTPSYYNIAATDTKDASCTLFMRKANVKGYDITIGEWYANYFPEEEIPAYLTYIKDTKLSDYFAEIYVFRGNVTKETVKEGSVFGYYDANKNWVGYFENGSLTPNVAYMNPVGIKEDALDAFASNSSSNFIAKYQGCTIPYFKDAMGNYISLDLLFNAGYDSHKMLMKLNEDYIEDNPPASTDGATTAENYLNVGQAVTTTVYLQGYTYETLKDKANIPFAVLDTLIDNKGIYTALTNNVDVQYHYIVDTFQSYPSEAGIKSKLALIAKEKGNAFAILNFPPMTDILALASVNGDVEKVPATVSLVGEQNGASYCAYYTQLKFSDGTVKSIVPSAALVSNLFMDKWSARQPYYVVAGPNYGRIDYAQLVGPDYNYGRSDLDVLEPMGVNAIIYVPRKGTYINSNQTAKQNPVSALSKIHIRELVIYLQNEVESMLQSYQWELNTAALRATVKAKADAILENVQNNGGVYAYTNICDESNNTPEVIDNEMIILDTEIEPARAAGKMVFRLKIHKTGGLTSE